ncbi:MAG: HisA/HisF-related TIM barrel protein, partial [Firmicutes bacterium]|nr:HisA/HisF-related TIM barrel protein [Bacillota bacterium]
MTQSHKSTLTAAPAALDLVPVLHIASGRLLYSPDDASAPHVAAQSNPLRTALDWMNRGGHSLHIVDLDASSGKQTMSPALLMALRNHGMRLSIAGGISTIADAQLRLRYGATHLTIGRLLKRPDHLVRLIRHIGRDKIVASLRLCHGQLLYADGQILSPEEYRQLLDLKIPFLLLTADTTDHLLSRPN